MIMKKLVLSFAAVAALASCVQNDITGPSESKTVSIVAQVDQTKTVLDGNAVLWENGDAVALRFASDSDVYTEVFTTAQSGATVTFSGTLDNGVNVSAGYAANGYAVYPSTAMSEAGAVEFTLESQVVAKENGSFDSGKNLSSAVVSLSDLNSKGSTNANFQNAFSIVRFTLDAGVASLKITADGNIAGKTAMSFQEDGRLVVGSWSEASRTLTVSPEGSTFTAGKTYNVLVYPGNYTSLTALLTDANGCTYEKTVTGNFKFDPSKFYTFTFNTQFVKSYTFTATGRNFVTGDQIYTVFGSLHSEALTATGAQFTGNLPASVVEANTEGYAIYPASAYNAGRISYTLNSAAPAELYSATLSPTSTTVAFNSVESALATVNFSVPTGVKSVKIVSDKGLTGQTEMTVSAGKLVAGTGAGKELTVDTTAGGSYSLKVYPVSGAALTVTLTDAAGATVQKNLSLTVAAGQTQTLDISSGLSFEKNGSFTNESYGNGGTHEF